MSNVTNIEEPKDRIQILDFHTSNPIISYQNQMYSCEWTSTIGTDVLITAPDPDFPHPILKQEDGVSIIAATGIKLLGRPAQMSSRPSASTENEPTQTATPAAEDSGIAANDRSTTENPKSTRIPENLLLNKTRQTQASFLERLIAVKASKEEQDDVTVLAQKVNQKSGWRSQAKAVQERRASEAQDAESTINNGDVDESAPVTSTGQGSRGHLRGRSGIGRPRRGNWRRTGPRTQKGGLFRDYRPSLFDTAGADIRGTPSATPRSWDQRPISEPLNKEAAIINTHPPQPPRASSPRISPPSPSTPHPQCPSPAPAPANQNQTLQTQLSASALSPQNQNPTPASPPSNSTLTTPSYRVSASVSGAGVPSLGVGGGDEGTTSDLEGRTTDFEVGSRSGHGVGESDAGIGDEGENGSADVEMGDA